MNKPLLATLVLAFALTGIGCEKDGPTETIVPIKGRLLYSSSDPRPVPNFRLGVYESVSGNSDYFWPDLGPLKIITTDGNGNFDDEISIVDRPIVVNGVEVSPISLAGIDSTVNSFVCNNFYTGGDGTFFMYKKIDTAYIVLTDSININANDTILINYYSAAGPRLSAKSKTGITLTGVGPVVFDTLYDIALVEYNYVKQTYNNSLQVIKDSAEQRFSLYPDSPKNIAPGDTSAYTFRFKFKN